MKMILVVGLFMSLVGCTKPVSEWSGMTTSLRDVSGLQDCTVTIVDRGSAASPDRVYRCPNSSTTTRYTCGKGCEANLTVVDGDVASPSDLSDNSSVESKH